VTTVLRHGTGETILSLDTPFNPSVGDEFQLGTFYGNRELPRKFLVVKKRVIFPKDHCSGYRFPAITIHVEEIPLNQEDADLAKQEHRNLAMCHGRPLPEGEW
jgi:hypothetical protein